MKTYFYIGAAVAAVLSASTVNAQVLGSAVGGGLGGTLSGGMHDFGVTTQGNGNGALGSRFDTGSLAGRASDLTGRVGSRVRNTGDVARGHAESVVGKAKDETASATAAATGKVQGASDAARQTEIPRPDAASSGTGSLASATDLADGGTSNGLSGTLQQEVASAPATVPASSQPTLVPAQPPVGGQPQAHAPTLLNSSGTTAPPAEASAGKEAPLPVAGGPLAGAMSDNGNTASAASSSSPIITAQGEGAASGNAAASRQGVSANASGTGSTNASMGR